MLERVSEGAVTRAISTCPTAAPRSLCYYSGMHWRSTARHPPPSSPRGSVSRNSYGVKTHAGIRRRDAGSVGARAAAEAVQGPREVVLKECEKWCLEFDGGKYAKLAPAFCKSGKTLAVIYRGDLVAAGRGARLSEPTARRSTHGRSASSSRTRKANQTVRRRAQDGARRAAAQGE